MNVAFGLPALLGGMALFVVPLLIHLLNRRRYVVQPFAMMRFLQEAFAQRRRRLRLESLLLLLLRCLLVLLAALAMALPFVPEDSPLAAVTGGRREVVCLVDRSGSMGRLLAPGVTADDRVLAALRRRLGRLSDERGDAVTLIAMGSGPTLLAPIGATPSVALAALNAALPAPGGVADVVAAARLLRDRVRPARPGWLEVVVFTDLQRLTWADAGPPLSDLLGAVFADGGGTLRIVPAVEGGDALSNLGVQTLSADDPLLLAREPLAFTATVRNWSDTARTGLEGRFFVDERQVAVQKLDVPPQATATATLRTRIDVPGAHHVRFALEPDALPVDDTRTLAFPVRERITVLLVDGMPGGADPLSGATGFLRLALAPDEDRGVTGGTAGAVSGAAGNAETRGAAGGSDLGELTADDGTAGAGADAGADAGGGTGADAGRGAGGRFEPLVWDTGRLEEAGPELSQFDAIVLANVGGLSSRAAESLAAAVRSGTPLLLFAGDGVVPQLWNERLLPLGLLPATVGEVRGDPGGRGGEDYVTLSLPDPAPPALALFADPRLAVLLQVPVFAWRELLPAPDSRVLASFADALGHTSPAIVEGRLERGRVMLVGTSADTRWSLLPRNPALWVPLVHELVGALVAPDPSATNVPVGQAPTVVVDGFPLSAQLTWPSGAVAVLERPETERVGARAILRLDSTPLDDAGAYRLEVRTAESPAPAVIALAAVPDAREGDVRPVDAAFLVGAMPDLHPVLGDELQEDADRGGPPGDGSLAAALLWALLGVALAEGLLARQIGTAR